MGIALLLLMVLQRTTRKTSGPGYCLSNIFAWPLVPRHPPAIDKS